MTEKSHKACDHSDDFIQSVTGDHFAHHARALGVDGRSGTESLVATTMAASA